MLALPVLSFAGIPDYKVFMLALPVLSFAGTPDYKVFRNENQAMPSIRALLGGKHLCLRAHQYVSLVLALFPKRHATPIYQLAKC